LVQDPQLVVLAGELTRAGGILLSAVGEELRTRLAWREPPRLVIATARTPGLYGAALLAWNALDPS
jgi:glucokinase